MAYALSYRVKFTALLCSESIKVLIMSTLKTYKFEQGFEVVYDVTYKLTYKIPSYYIIMPQLLKMKCMLILRNHHLPSLLNGRS